MISTTSTSHVLSIEIDNPGSLNAISASDFHDLAEIWESYAQDSQARCAVISGSGSRAFSVGANVKEFQGDRSPDAFWHNPSRGYGHNLEDGRALWKPVISAIDGYCLGGGLVLALGTDIRIATRRSSFGLPEVKIGTNTVTGASLLAREIGPSRAARIALVGDRIDADTAYDWGLVTELVDGEHDEVLARAHQLADLIAANGPRAVQATKEVIRRSADMDFRDVLALGESLREIVSASGEFEEGVAAFVEKREPHFR
ncbi:crotonase/enoyl-CoA hydratase family protein [Brooklawnia cerclae]